MSLHRDPEFLEADLYAYITRLLERCHISRPDVQICQISQAEESGLGYDACITSICPFYVQLKRSYFYPANSTSAIIQDRSKLNLPVDEGAYFFKLHRTSKHASDLQHNLLYRLSQSEAAGYLAPLFFRRRALQELEQDYALWAWRYGQLTIADMAGTPTPIRHVRLLHKMITIPPHIAVADANHRYSFTSPADVCFHSDPERVQGDGIVTFADFIGRIGPERADRQGNGMRSPERAAGDVIQRLPDVLGLQPGSHTLREMVRRSFEQILGPEFKIPKNPTAALMRMDPGPLVTLRIVGNLLEYEWGIRQYAVVKRAQ